MNLPLNHHTTTGTGLERPARQAPEHERAAIAALGHELRALVDATVRTAARRRPCTAWRRESALSAGS
jgi:hypothetical protein